MLFSHNQSSSKSSRSLDDRAKGVRSGRSRFFGRFFKSSKQENNLVELLQSLPFFDEQWAIYQNVQLPDAEQDTLDIVLVGPTGIYAIEVRADSNSHRFKHGMWQKELSYGRWVIIEWHPLKQAEHNAKRCVHAG